MIHICETCLTPNPVLFQSHPPCASSSESRSLLLLSLLQRRKGEMTSCLPSSLPLSYVAALTNHLRRANATPMGALPEISCMRSHRCFQICWHHVTPEDGVSCECCDRIVMTIFNSQYILSHDQCPLAYWALDEIYWCASFDPISDK